MSWVREVGASSVNTNVVQLIDMLFLMLQVQNGQQVTRGLKNENLRGPAKGTISLVMEVHYNPVRTHWLILAKLMLFDN